MNILESFRVAMTGLMANRLRSVLTMLGIIIGVASVIGLISFGEGFQNFVNGQFQSIGSNLLGVVATTPRGTTSKDAKAKPLTLGDAQAMANPLYVSGVAAVAPDYSVTARIVANGNDLDLSVSGTTPQWQAVREWSVQDGRFIDESDVATAARVAVLGTSTVKKLFDAGTEPVGQEIRVNNVSFRVVGVLTEKGGGGMVDQDRIALVPITTAQIRLGEAAARTASGEYKVSMIYLKALGDNSQAVKTDVERLLTERHKIEFKGDEDFMVVTQDQVMAAVGNILGVLTVFLVLIAGISLVVGGIGVMNIMLVSVTERTREIGLRKAVGARYSDLMIQFLIESVVLTLGGGLIGVLLGASFVFVSGRLIPSLSLSITPPAVLLATGVCTFIGIFFGLYPASRAAALDPIEALRYE